MTTATPTEKTCTRCGEVKPLADYHRKAASRDGHYARCKVCVLAQQKVYRESNREELAAKQRERNRDNRDHNSFVIEVLPECEIDLPKPCSACGMFLPLTEFRRNASTYDGFSYHCRSCADAVNQAYREKHRESYLEYGRAYYQAHREKNREKCAAYREKNREEILAQQRARHAERWATDPEYRARYKAAKTRRYRLLASAKQEPYLRDEIFERDGWICGICDEPIDPTIRYEDDPGACATIDHIVPLSRGGDDTPANVQAAHGSCNYGKCNRIEHEDQEVAA